MSETFRFARRLHEHERRIAASERAAQAARRSIEGGTIDAYNGDGELVQRLGVLEDGQVGVRDLVQTPPAAPGEFEALGGVDCVVVSWDGSWAEEQAADVTPAYVGVHLVIPVDPDDPEDVPLSIDEETEVARLPVEGGEVVVPSDAEVPVDVILVAVSAAGVWSAESAPVLAEALPVVELADVAGTDGLPPATSPLPEAFGGIGTVVVRVPEVDNDDAVTVALYASLTPGVDVDSGDDHAGNVPNGGGAIIASVDGHELTAGDRVYVRARAFDEDGFAEEASAEVSAVVLTVDYEQVSENIRNAITEADSKAAGAQSDAARALADALAAFEAAQGADGKASAAQGAADAAQESADAKGKVLVQNGAPSAADRLPQNLWIDTTGGANTPKRWNATSSAWEAVTDKAATDAAAAAATANTKATDAQTKANAAVRQVVTQYTVSSSETTAPTTGWGTATPTRTPGTFVWYRVVVTYGDGTTSTSSPALLTGNTGARGVEGPRGADGQTTYTWIKYADTPTSGMADAPAGKTYMGIAYNKPTATESSAYGDYLWSLIKGADGSPGAPGKGISSTEVTYQTHTSGTGNGPSGTWQGAPTATSPGQFLWTRTITTYTDGSKSTAYAVAAHGQTGQQGAPGGKGDTGAAGRGISGTSVTYQVGSSGTNYPTGAWQNGPQPTSPGQYHWTRTVTSYTDGSPATTAYAVAAHGATGQQGIEGPRGADGQPTYTWVKYATSAQGANIADEPAGKTHIGLAYNKPTATESSNPQDYQWALIQGAPGADGADGAPGADGRGVTGTTVTYQTHSSGTDAPTGGTWSTGPTPTSPGQFLWTRTVTTYSSGQPTTSYAVSAHGSTGQKGDTGSTGPQGVSITSVVPFYRTVATGAAAPAKPTANPAPSPWTTTEPTYATNTELYRTERVLLSNGTFTYTDVVKSSAYSAATSAAAAAATADGKATAAQTAASNAQAAANAKGKVIIQSGAPAAADQLAQNLWIDTGNGNVAKRWTGSAWVVVQDAAIQSAASQAAAAQLAADQAIDAATTASATANGKNAVRYGPAITSGTPTSPQGTADGDLYFGRTNGIVMQQWRRVSGAWVQDRIDGAVLTNLDAGSMTVGTATVATLLDAEAILAKIAGFGEVTAEHVAADVMVVNDFYTRNGIRAGIAGAAGLDFDVNNGLLQRGPDGEPTLHFPINGQGNFFKGDLTVESARAQKFVMLGGDNLVQRGGRLVMASKTEPPSRPTVQHYWPNPTVPHDPINPADPWGDVLEHLVHQEVVGTNHVMLGVRGDYDDAAQDWKSFDIVRFNLDRTTLMPTSSPTVVVGGFAEPPHSMCISGSRIWVNLYGAGRLQSFSFTGARDADFARHSSGHQSAQGIFDDNGTLRFWRQNNATEFGVWTVRKTDGALTAYATMVRPVSSMGKAIQMLAGTFDLGSRMFLVVSENHRVHGFAPTGERNPRGDFELSTARMDDEYVAWCPSPSGSQKACFASTGWYLDASLPLFTRYTDLLVDFAEDSAPTRAEVFVGATWARDADRRYETQLGATTRARVPVRAALQVTLEQWPGESDPPQDYDVNRAAIYTLAGAYVYRRQVVLENKQTVWRSEVLPSEPVSGGGPPTLSTFPDSESGSGVIASGSGGLALYGNGDAKKEKDPVVANDIANKRYVDAVYGTTVQFAGGSEILPYSSGNVVTLRRNGAVVTIMGEGGPSSGSLDGINGSSEAAKPVFCYLPVGYRPPVTITGLQQGSSANKWTSRVYSDGRVTGYRYSPGNAATSAWLPFFITFITDDPPPAGDRIT